MIENMSKIFLIFIQNTGYSCVYRIRESDVPRIFFNPTLSLRKGSQSWVAFTAQEGSDEPSKTWPSESARHFGSLQFSYYTVTCKIKIFVLRQVNYYRYFELILVKLWVLKILSTKIERPHENWLSWPWMIERKSCDACSRKSTLAPNTLHFIMMRNFGEMEESRTPFVMQERVRGVGWGEFRSFKVKIILKWKYIL